MKNRKNISLNLSDTDLESRMRTLANYLLDRILEDKAKGLLTISQLRFARGGDTLKIGRYTLRFLEPVYQ